MTRRVSQASTRQWLVAGVVLTIAVIAVAASYAIISDRSSRPADDATAAISLSDPSALCDSFGIAGNHEIDASPPAEFAASMHEARAAGASRIRLGVLWSEVEPTRGEYAWANVDHKIKAALDNDLVPLLLLNHAPDWARDLMDDEPEETARVFANFAGEVAKRYGDDVEGYEIWNEPNTQRFWNQPDPDDYALMLDQSYDSIHAADENATVISAGLAPADDGDGSVAPLTFLTRLYERGAEQHVDAIGLHPYTYPELPSGSSPWNSFRIMDEIREMMAEHRDTTTPFWFTEFGAPTDGDRSVGEHEQKGMIAEAFNLAAADARIGPVFLYTLRDLDLGAGNPESNFGLYSENGEPKPVVNELQRISSSCH